MRLLFVLQGNIKDLLDSFEEINLLSSSNEVRRPKGPKATDAFIPRRRSLIRIFMINHLGTFARCKKYPSKLGISRSLIRTFAW